MPKKQSKKASRPVRPQLGEGVEILNAGSVLEDPITRTLETNYMPYAMSVHRQPGAARDRRLQARPPQAAVHHVRDGAAQGRPDQVGQHRGRHHAPEPPRRRRHLRHHGPDGPRQREPAGPLCGQQGQLRQGLQPGYVLRRRPLHRGAAGAGLRRTVPGHRQGDGGLCPQLRRHHHRADPAARHLPGHSGQQHPRHRGGHGLQHLLVQPGRAVRHHHRPHQRPAARHRLDHARPRLCGRRPDPLRRGPDAGDL